MEHMYRSFMFYPADLVIRVAEEKARDSQAESTHVRSPVAVLEDGNDGKPSEKEEGEGGYGGHAEVESAMRKLQNKLRRKDERLKKSESTNVELAQKLLEKEEEIERLKMELQVNGGGVLKKDV